ncbi:hypothetical protein QVD17_03361 [Tagetes erecta]|uniref:Uncharacterized protein n=1 Tax=Tagetes erecta TaxID=13708 RepID=A0AAD8P9V2_TARER|nr:hypothetical protein QVD17_03361 [Tagetes erecta]
MLLCLCRTDHTQTLPSADCLFSQKHFIKNTYIRVLLSADLDQPLLRSFKHSFVVNGVPQHFPNINYAVITFYFFIIIIIIIIIIITVLSSSSIMAI